MNCLKRKRDLALYAGRDLPSGRTAEVESHLSECTGCRAFLEELQAGKELLNQLREEPLDEAMVAQVRRRVLARMEAERPAMGHPYWKLAVAAALMLAAVLWVRWPSQDTRPVVRVGVASPVLKASALPQRAVAAKRVGIGRRGHSPLRRARARKPASPLLVQFVTDDPNIVIYWLVDRTPEGD